MIRTSLVVLASILVCSASVSVAEDAFVLAREGSSPALMGKSVTRTTVREMKDGDLGLEMGEKKVPGKVTSKEATSEIVEFISPVKARRTLTSRTSENRMVVMDQERLGPKKEDPLQGLPVIVEKKDGKWTATLEKGEPTPQQKIVLDGLTKNRGEDEDRAIYGDVPRKPGDKWVVDLAKLPSFGEVIEPKGSFSIEFVEVKEIQGTSCAVLKSTMDLSGKMTQEGGESTMTIKMKGDVIVHRSLADLIDLESKTSVTMDMDGMGRPGMKMRIAGPVTITRTATLAKP